MFLATNAYLWFNGVYDAFTVLIIFLCVTCLYASFAAARDHGTHRLASFTLTLIVGRGIYYAVLQPAYHLLSHGSHASQQWLTVVATAAACLLLVWLVVAYATGAASRRYFGFSSKTGADLGSVDPR